MAARLACFTVLVFGVFTSLVTSAETNNTLLENVLSALVKVVDFLKQNYQSITFDGHFGLRIVEGQLRLLLAEYEHGRHRTVPATIMTQLRHLAEAATKVANMAVPHLLDQDSRTFNIVRYQVQNPWLMFHSHRLTDSSSRWESSGHKKLTDITEEERDKCIAELTGTASKDKQKCSVSAQCLKNMLSYGRHGYSLQHQILYVAFVERVGCSTAINDYLRNEGGEDKTLEKVQQVFCSNAHYELTKNIFLYGLHPSLKDLFLQAQFTCPDLGFFEFLQNDWLSLILSWQKPTGCFTLGSAASAADEQDHKSKQHPLVAVKNTGSAAERPPPIHHPVNGGQQNYLDPRLMVVPHGANSNLMHFQNPNVLQIHPYEINKNVGAEHLYGNHEQQPVPDAVKQNLAFAQPHAVAVEQRILQPPVQRIGQIFHSDHGNRAANNQGNVALSDLISLNKQLVGHQVQNAGAQSNTASQNTVLSNEWKRISNIRPQAAPKLFPAGHNHIIHPIAAHEIAHGRRPVAAAPDDQAGDVQEYIHGERHQLPEHVPFVQSDMGQLPQHVMQPQHVQYVQAGNDHAQQANVQHLMQPQHIQYGQAGNDHAAQQANVHNHYQHDSRDHIADYGNLIQNHNNQDVPHARHIQEVFRGERSAGEHPFNSWGWRSLLWADTDQDHHENNGYTFDRDRHIGQEPANVTKPPVYLYYYPLYEQMKHMGEARQERMKKRREKKQPPSARKLLRDRGDRGLCHDYITGRAASALVMYVRYMIDPGPLEFHHMRLNKPAGQFDVGLENAAIDEDEPDEPHQQPYDLHIRPAGDTDDRLAAAAKHLQEGKVYDASNRRFKPLYVGEARKQLHPEEGEEFVHKADAYKELEDRAFRKNQQDGLLQNQPLQNPVEVEQVEAVKVEDNNKVVPVDFPDIEDVGSSSQSRTSYDEPRMINTPLHLQKELGLHLVVIITISVVCVFILYKYFRHKKYSSRHRTKLI